MSESDKKIYNFDPMTISWKKYMENYYFGIKKFVLKESSLSSPSTFARLRRLKFAKYFLKFSTIAAGSYLVWTNGGREAQESLRNKFVR